MGTMWAQVLGLYGTIRDLTGLDYCVEVLETKEDCGETIVSYGVGENGLMVSLSLRHFAVHLDPT